ncbi:MAG TPA: hypothetical protein VFT45_12710 [Longimicrobium sp.]|nr:hypothetical protein [Longimicrobium sp.]
MRKLKLDVHTLRVESFEPIAEDGARRGTVRGNDATPDCSEEIECSGGYDTCFGESCVITACLTCLCPHTGPQPSCDPCSWNGCESMEVAGC